MKVNITQASPVDLAVDALVVIAHEHELIGACSQVDQATGGLISRLIADGDLSTKPGKTFVIVAPPGLQARTLLVCGGGTRALAAAGDTVRIAGAAAKRLADRQRKTVAMALEPSPGQLSLAVCAAINGCVGQDVLRTEKSYFPPEELLVLGDDAAEVHRGQVLGESMLLVRDLVNLPPNLMTPVTFTQRAQRECSECGIELEIWDEVRLRKERCDSMLGVAAGSLAPPRLLIMRYAGQSGGGTKPIALVGKGVTFDSGGLSIKPSDSMLSMKCDMAGAATVLGTMRAAALLRIEQPIVGLVGLVENMISGSAFKLGDVLRARSGTTIEVHNTDAEGRLVLADVLNVALEQSPKAIIDLATLTGACVVALGVDIAGMMTNAPWLQQQFQAAAERAGELVWPLPMHRFFDDQITSQVADIKNVGDGRWGGAITAAKFLERFVGSTPWLHIDIAGPAFADKPKSYQDAGATGAMLRSLIEYLVSDSEAADADEA